MCKISLRSDGHERKYKYVLIKFKFHKIFVSGTGTWYVLVLFLCIYSLRQRRMTQKAKILTCQNISRSSQSAGRRSVITAPSHTSSWKAPSLYYAIGLDRGGILAEYLSMHNAGLDPILQFILIYFIFNLPSKFKGFSINFACSNCDEVITTVFCTSHACRQNAGQQLISQHFFHFTVQSKFSFNIHFLRL